jgi:hypothetical protein
MVLLLKIFPNILYIEKMVDYKSNKIHIYKWRENNKEKYRMIGKLYKRRIDAWKKESKTFLKILLN